MLKKLFKLLFVFICCVMSADAFMKFEVNRVAALLAQAYFEKAISEDLYIKLISILTTNSENQAAEILQFVMCLINKKPESKYITGEFTSIWNNALSKYDRVFDSNSDILNNRKLELTLYYDQISKKELAEINRVFVFYKTTSSKCEPFVVYIYSTEQTGTYAERIGNIIFLRFNYAKKINDICMIYRKICNRLFETLPPKNKSFMENYFINHNSKHAKAAYFLLNEVLAYTIGELWVYSKLSNAADSPKQNHPDENINKIANALLPLIQKYLKSCCILNKEFYDAYIKIVEQQYPKANLKYDVMLSNISLIVENGIDLESCENELKSSFPIKQITFKPSAFSTIFIGNNIGDPALSRIQSKIPNKKNDFLLVTNDANGKLFVLIKSNDEKRIKTAINTLKEQKEIRLDFIKDL